MRVGTCTDWLVRGRVPVQYEIPAGVGLVRVQAYLRDGETIDLPVVRGAWIDSGSIRKVVFYQFVLPRPRSDLPPATIHMEEGAQRVSPDADGWCRTSVRLTALYGPVVIREVRVLGINSDLTTPLSNTLQAGESLVVPVEARAYGGGARNVGIHATWSQLDAAHRIGSSSRGFTCEAP